MIDRHIKVYANGITPIEFCGEPILWKIETDGLYEVPFPIEPTTGEHDFETCEGCQKTYGRVLKFLTQKFEGNDKRQPFPLCCEHHAGLNTLKGFDRNSFIDVPKFTAQKLLYTYQHIVNNYQSDVWLKTITDYIDWAIESLGQMPKQCGEPLFISDFFFYLRSQIHNNKDIPQAKKDKLIEYLEFCRNPIQNSSTDINVLMNTYQKWYKIFPFELNSYFGDLQQHYKKNFPLLNGQPEYNPFSGKSSMKFHSKETLIEELLRLTNDLIIRINATTLYEKGLLSDSNKIQLELLMESRKLKIKKGYINQSLDEESRYRKILKSWFKDEMKFFKDLMPILKNDKKILDRKDFNNWLFGKPAWREAAYQINTGKAYTHKQDLIALFWNNYVYYQQKFEKYFIEFKVIPVEIFNNLVFEFRQSFPPTGRIEGVNYFDDLIELLIQKYSKDGDNPKTENNSVDVEKISRTKALIVEELQSIDKVKGYLYAFLNEHDFDRFVDILASYFEFKEYKLPIEPIRMVKYSKTRLAKSFNPIYKQLSNENKTLKTDKEFFKILRTLSFFSHETDHQIYQSITR